MKLFKTVASMKLATITTGQTVKTQGYYEAGDGNNAVYLIEAPQAADEKNDFALANGNVAVEQRRPVATTTQLTDLTHAVNAGRKILGGMVFNTTTNKLVCASGELASSVWVNCSTGTTEHTPI